jgi:hypothetical protein
MYFFVWPRSAVALVQSLRAVTEAAKCAQNEHKFSAFLTNFITNFRNNKPPCAVLETILKQMPHSQRSLAF